MSADSSKRERRRRTTTTRTKTMNQLRVSSSRETCTATKLWSRLKPTVRIRGNDKGKHLDTKRDTDTCIIYTCIQSVESLGTYQGLRGIRCTEYAQTNIVRHAGIKFWCRSSTPVFFSCLLSRVSCLLYSFVSFVYRSLTLSTAVDRSRRKQDC